MGRYKIIQAFWDNFHHGFSKGSALIYQRYESVMCENIKLQITCEFVYLFLFCIIFLFFL